MLPSFKRRIEGCLLAGALGDSIGANFEGRPGDPNFAIPHKLQVTDDTQLTLATCQSIIGSGSLSPSDVAKNFLNWFRARRLSGVGASTLKALRELDAGGHWASVGARGERAAGNGAAMRIAPLAFLLNPRLEEGRRTIRDVSRISHHNEEAYTGALAVATSVYEVAEGNLLGRELITEMAERLPDSRVRDRFVYIIDDSLTLEQYASRFSLTGYVVDSVPFAILCAVEASSLLDIISRIVRFGGDTDTIASICGQIYGTAYPDEILGLELVNRIDDISSIKEIVVNFSEVAFKIKSSL